MAGKQAITIVPFSHLDLFWGGSREECLSRGCSIIRNALDMLQKYDDFCFMLESTNFLEHHLECFPDDLERIRSFAASGRLELIPMRSIIYSHLPSGETTVRNILYGRECCRKNGVEYSQIMSLSDIPGATPQTPQIALRCGMKQLILSRGCPEHTDQLIWRALDGSHLPTYYPWHYCGLYLQLDRDSYELMLDNESKFEEYAGAVDYPQVMHWGIDLAVFSEDVYSHIKRWNKEGHRELKFSTFRDFFTDHELSPNCEASGEIPSFWPNIESSWPDIWPLDVVCENMLFKAEFFRSLSLLNSMDNPDGKPLKDSWLWLLDGMDHNQNGIGGVEADDDKRRLKTTACDVARLDAERSARRLAARVTAPVSGAFPIVVFNPLSWERTELVTARATVYGKTRPSRHGWGKPVAYRLIDAEGRAVAYKQLDYINGLADAITVEFVASDVPAYGAKVYYIEPVAAECFSSPFKITDDRTGRLENANQPIGSDRCENEYFILKIDRITGDLNIYDKAAGRTMLERGGLVALEERGGDYIANMPLSGRKFPALIDSVEWVDNNAVSCRAEICGRIYGQIFKQIITLCAGKAEVEIENIIQWNEIRPVRIEQAFTFSPADGETEYRYGVPFGQVRFPETIYGEDVPFEKVSLPELGNESDPKIRNIRLINNWISACNNSGGMVIGADHRMWEFEGDTIRNCMIRGIAYTTGGQHVCEDGSRVGTIRPPVGEYRFRFRIVPQQAGIIPHGRCGWELNNPLHCVAVGFSDAATGKAGLELLPMLDCSGSTVNICNIKPAESLGQEIVFRCFESTGQQASLALHDVPGGKWFEADLMEENQSCISGSSVSFGPFEIKTIILQLDAHRT